MNQTLFTRHLCRFRLTLLASTVLTILPAAAGPVPALHDIYRNDFLVGVAVGPYVYQGCLARVVIGKDAGAHWKSCGQVSR